MDLVKNFTDPIGLSAVAPIIKVIPLKTCSSMFLPKLGSSIKIDIVTDNKPIWIKPIIYKQLGTVLAKVPKPPVGKMLISTFPPIYKERSNYTGIADSPRIYPPIYINHTT